MKENIGMISLGCCKNQVDGEIMLAALKKAGYNICGDIDSCDAVIVNTCGFIEDAKQEAIDTILETAELKKSGRLRVLAVTGCLAERYREQVAEQLPEADVVLGIGSNADIVRAIEKALKGERILGFGEKTSLCLEGERILANQPWYAYVKIAEGCSNCCTYCAIPMIRGPFRSRTQESIVDEVRKLAASGVKEINLVAQDTSRYGLDIYGESRLPELMEAVCAVEGVEWVRVLYCYPERITDRLLDVMAAQPKAVKYLDIPMQHASGRILKAMNRTGDREQLLSLTAHIREKLPGVVLRTTLMTGFPGETESDFEELCLFVQEARFERLGCFAYSAEEGTPAGRMEQLDMDIRLRRQEIIMELQANVAFEFASEQTGRTLPVLVEGQDEDGYYVGRSYMDAPDIDTRVYFSSLTKRVPGNIIDVVITDSTDYDLRGCAVEPEGTRCELPEKD